MAEDRYKILREEYRKDLSEAVNHWIWKGYEPIGGVTIEPEYNNDGRIFYLQAMFIPDNRSLERL